MGNFRKLQVWTKSKDLAVAVYRVTNEGSIAKDFRFRDQLRAAAVSIPSNIAEGDESGTNANAIRYFNISKGSCAELITQLIIAEEVGYISIETRMKFEDQTDHIARMLSKLIQSRRS
jgi:four helix bundle protein